MGLSIAERADVAEQLWDSVPERLDPALEVKLKRRLEEIDSGRATMISGPEGLAMIRKKAKRPLKLK